LLPAIDLHVHTGPDVRPRKTTALELGHAARSAGLGGFVLKRHQTSTVAEAALLRGVFPELLVAGGLTLNREVGGLNVAAVETALAMGAAIIWMPTHDAAHHRAWAGKAGGIGVLDEAGRLLPEALEIVALVADAGALLALGHLSPRELHALVLFGRQRRARLLVNHPEIEFLDLPVSLQRELAGPELIFERAFVRKNQVVSWQGLAARIRELGVESAALVTDLGQPENPDPVTGMGMMLEALAAEGFSDAELETMACANPRRALGDRVRRLP
jgi:hypothetical protein